ncbi:hypothetical protein [Nocardia gamkensis]|uniref:hypothetical protein n=1 Tax=Nocardia gamkensis TaxID=352869 RepID=UPI00406B987E
MARRLSRAASTISREVRRNTFGHDRGRYDADLAHARAAAACPPSSAGPAADRSAAASGRSGQAGTGLEPAADQRLVAPRIPCATGVACQPRNDLSSPLQRRKIRLSKLLTKSSADSTLPAASAQSLRCSAGSFHHPVESDRGAPGHRRSAHPHRRLGISMVLCSASTCPRMPPSSGSAQADLDVIAEELNNRPVESTDTAVRRDIR